MKKEERNIEVFIARCDENTHTFWSGEPESLGFFSQKEIDWTPQTLFHWFPSSRGYHPSSLQELHRCR